MAAGHVTGGRAGGGRWRRGAAPRPSLGGAELSSPRLGAAGGMQSVINTVKGKALEVAEYLTPVLKVLQWEGGRWRG